MWKCVRGTQPDADAGTLTDRNGTAFATPPTIGALEYTDVIFGDGFESGNLTSWDAFFSTEN